MKNMTPFLCCSSWHRRSIVRRLLRYRTLLFAFLARSQDASTWHTAPDTTSRHSDYEITYGYGHGHTELSVEDNGRNVHEASCDKHSHEIQAKASDNGHGNIRQCIFGGPDRRCVYLTSNLPVLASTTTMSHPPPYRIN